MKTLVAITTICLITLNSFSQSIIYVSSKSDKRLLEYEKKYNEWKQNEEYKKKVISKVGAVRTYAEYQRVDKEIGFGDPSKDKIIKSQKTGKSYVYSKGNPISEVFYERLFQTSDNGYTNFMFSAPIIRKPTPIIIYKPIKISPPKKNFTISDSISLARGNGSYITISDYKAQDGDSVEIYRNGYLYYRGFLKTSGTQIVLTKTKCEIIIIVKSEGVYPSCTPKIQINGDNNLKTMRGYIGDALKITIN